MSRRYHSLTWERFKNTYPALWASDHLHRGQGVASQSREEQQSREQERYRRRDERASERRKLARYLGSKELATQFILERLPELQDESIQSSQSIIPAPRSENIVNSMPKTPELPPTPKRVRVKKELVNKAKRNVHLVELRHRQISDTEAKLDAELLLANQLVEKSQNEAENESVTDDSESSVITLTRPVKKLKTQARPLIEVSDPDVPNSVVYVYDQPQPHNIIPIDLLDGEADEPHMPEWVECNDSSLGRYIQCRDGRRWKLQGEERLVQCGSEYRIELDDGITSAPVPTASEKAYEWWKDLLIANLSLPDIDTMMQEGNSQ
jgi:hypothetical protein